MQNQLCRFRSATSSVRTRTITTRSSSGAKQRQRVDPERNTSTPSSNKSGTDGNTLKPSEKSNPTPVSNDYCLQLVKRYDYDNFLATLLIPDARLRTAVFALRAFNCEIALIRDQVTQAHIGLGRFAFWKDAVRQLFKPPAEASESGRTTLARHPVILELSRTICTADSISQKWFHNLIDSREQVMNDTPFATLTDLERYADQSVTPILYLTFEFMKIKSLNLDHCASHLGKAIGLTNFIRGLPYNSQKRRVLVPQDLMIKHNISQEKFVRLDEPSKIHEVVYDIAASAHLHYQKAKSLREATEKEVKNHASKVNPFTVFLSALPSKIYLQKLEKCNFNPYDPKLVRRNSMLPWQLYYRKLTRKYF